MNSQGFVSKPHQVLEDFLKNIIGVSVPASLLLEQDFLQSICFRCVWVEKSGLVWKISKEKYDGLTPHDVDCHHEQIQLTSYKLKWS